MIYTFKTRSLLLKHLDALCQLSSGVMHSELPMKDFSFDLPYLKEDCLLIKKMSTKFCNKAKIYIAFRTLGFESTTILHHFKQRVSQFKSTVLACYTITFEDGYYLLESFNPDNNETTI